MPPALRQNPLTKQTAYTHTTCCQSSDAHICNTSACSSQVHGIEHMVYFCPASSAAYRDDIVLACEGNSVRVRHNDLIECRKIDGEPITVNIRCWMQSDSIWTISNGKSMLTTRPGGMAATSNCEFALATLQQSHCLRNFGRGCGRESAVWHVASLLVSAKIGTGDCVSVACCCDQYPAQGRPLCSEAYKASPGKLTRSLIARFR